MSIKKISLISVIFLSACVTINVYFPAAATEKVADEIIQGIQKPELEQPQSQIVPESHIMGWQLSFYRLVDQAIAVVISSAQAAEMELPADSAEIRRLRASMRDRFTLLKGFYAQGVIAIKADGLLTQKGKAALKDRNKINKLIKVENRDRNDLYRAIAEANNHPEWFEQIKTTFAARWVGNAQSGWWYQTADGRWRQK